MTTKRLTSIHFLLTLALFFLCCPALRADLPAPATTNAIAEPLSGLTVNRLPGFERFGMPLYGSASGATDGRNFLVVNQYQTTRLNGDFPIWEIVADIYSADRTNGARTLEISDLRNPMGGSPGQGAKVASNGTNFLVVWWDGKVVNQVYFPGPVYGAIATLDPFVASAPFIICDDPAGQSNPEVASNGTDYYVTWLDRRDRSPANQPWEVAASVYGTRISADGAVKNHNGLALDRTASPVYSLALASNGQNYLAVWPDARAANRLPSIRGALVSQDGIPLGSSFAVSSGTTPQSDPLVTSDGTNYFVVWYEGLSEEVHGTSISTAGSVANSRGFPIQDAVLYRSFALGTLKGSPVFIWRSSRKLYAKVGAMNGTFAVPAQFVADMVDLYPVFIPDRDRLLVLDHGSSTAITLSAPVQAPTLFLKTSSGVLAYLLGGGAVRLDASLILEASEGTSFSQAQLTASPGGTGVLSVLPGLEGIAVDGSQILYQNSLVAVFVFDQSSQPAVLRIVFNANATQAAVQAVARSIAYSGDSPLPEPVNLQFVDAAGHASPTVKITASPLPQIVGHSASTNVDLGSTSIVSAEVIGYPFVWSEWRLNGIPIPGYTNFGGIGNLEQLRIPNFQLENSGAYTFSAQSPAGVTTSEPILLTPNVSLFPDADLFGQRLPLSATQGAGRGSNQSATQEPGEPSPAGKVGGRSVWFTWEAVTNGIATFRTAGSAFDTLLAIYTGPDLSTLVEIASDDDSGGFLTSKVKFNAVAGVTYQIALDGFNGAGGAYVLSWNLEVTSDSLPVILTQPASQAVPIDASAQFSVSASGSGLTYQWFFNNILLGGATAPDYTIPNVQFADIGKYTVRIRNDQGREIFSKPAFLETGPFREALSQDKLEDLLAGISRSQARVPRNGSLHTLAAPGPAFISVAPGGPDSKLLSNRDSTTEVGEPALCGSIGGASQWLAIRPETSGTVEIDTVGSNIDTLLAVYTGTSMHDLHEVACDSHGAPDGQRSRLQFSALAANFYLVAVDGQNGARGTIKINWNLQPADSGRLSASMRGGLAGPQLQLTASGSASLVLESSSDLRQWSPVRTNLPGNLQFLEPIPIGVGRKFYRLVK